MSHPISLPVSRQSNCPINKGIKLIFLKKRSGCDLTFDLWPLSYHAGPSLVGALKKDWASPNSIALSWQEPELPALLVLDYEIKYYEKVRAGRRCLKIHKVLVWNLFLGGRGLAQCATLFSHPTVNKPIYSVWRLSVLKIRRYEVFVWQQYDMLFQVFCILIL